jgi:hypothetical protein
MTRCAMLIPAPARLLRPLTSVTSLTGPLGATQFQRSEQPRTARTPHTVVGLFAARQPCSIQRGSRVPYNRASAWPAAQGLDVWVSSPAAQPNP